MEIFVTVSIFEIRLVKLYRFMLTINIYIHIVDIQ